MFVVFTRTAAMPQSCKGRYCNVAVVEVNYYDHNRGFRPTSIRAKAITRVASDRGPFCVGKTERCASAKAIAEAEALAQRLNSAGDQATVEDIIGAGGSA